MLLRIFFLGNLTHDQAVAYLAKEAQLVRDQQALLRDIEETADFEADDFGANGRLVLEYGRRLMAMTL